MTDIIKFCLLLLILFGALIVIAGEIYLLIEMIEEITKKIKGKGE